MAYDYHEIVDAIGLKGIEYYIKNGIRATFNVIITPQEAEELLKRNVTNRKLNFNTVGRYQQMMMDATWDWVDGDSALKFSRDGHLINGQHRLNAQVAANVVGVYLIQTGVPDTSYKVIDSHAPRKVADYFCGQTSNVDVSALASKIAMASSGYIGYVSLTTGKSGEVSKTLLKKMPTRIDIINFAQRNYEELLRYVVYGDRIRRQHKRGSKSAYAFALYALAKNGHGDVEDFVKAYVANEGETSITKQTVLKKLMTKNFSPKTEWYSSVLLLAYDAWKSGRPLKVIQQKAVETRTRREIDIFEENITVRGAACVA